jgi:membrane protease YdiL (CAAX protease family)
MVYFTLAYAGTWIAIAPLVIATRGLISLSEGMSNLLFILAPFAGPALAAYTVTSVVEGKAGVVRLFRRTFQMRAGLQWYAVAIFGFMSVWLIGYSAVTKGVPFANLIQNPSLLYSVFLPNVLLGLLIPSLGEEPGWRGFAFPRLQAQHGPILGTILLGVIHAIWHLPAFFTPFLGPFTLEGFTAFVLTAVAGTFVYTWIFNHTRGSVWIAMVVHASSNAVNQLFAEIMPVDLVIADPFKAFMPYWLNVIIITLAALILIILTRGRLGYKPGEMSGDR